jgi:ubiquitin-protein ligase
MSSISNKLRLARDIKDIMNYPLDNDGIYYRHDENLLNKGYAVIIGPEDTPYQYGYYLFTLIFSDEYPFKPPKVFFETGNNIVRFHPNLYKNRKVCLSILNTWDGEPWSSCQTIRSILLTLKLILTNDPLLHEPDICKFHSDFSNYTKSITYENLYISSFTYYNYFLKKKHIHNFLCFRKIILEHMNNNIDKILSIINEQKNKNDTITIRIYNYTSNIDYCKLYDYYMTIKNKNENENENENEQI